MIEGQYTREEILSQPEAWMKAIDVLKRNIETIEGFSTLNHHQQVLFTGCGSTYHLARAGAIVFQELTGTPANGLPASEIWQSSAGSFLPSEAQVLIAISRSGETTETLQACEKIRHNPKARIMTLVCVPDSRLAKMGDVNLEFPSGAEKSIAQTRAFTTLYLGVVGMSAIAARKSAILEGLRMLPRPARLMLDGEQERAALHGGNLVIDRIYFLGSGGRFGLACELSLKMKEMSLTHSEAFHFMEFRHGPKAMVNDSTIVVGLVSESNKKQELAVLNEVGELGAEIITIGENNTDVSFNSGVEEVLRNILYLPFGQMMAFERSIAKGLDPDHPIHLDAVVKLTQ